MKVMRTEKSIYLLSGKVNIMAPIPKFYLFLERRVQFIKDRLFFSRRGWGFRFNCDNDGYSVFKIGGPATQYISCGCEHDCCGHLFTYHIKTYFFGLVEIIYYARNV